MSRIDRSAGGIVASKIPEYRRFVLVGVESSNVIFVGPKRDGALDRFKNRVVASAAKFYRDDESATSIGLENLLQQFDDSFGKRRHVAKQPVEPAFSVPIESVATFKSNLRMLGQIAPQLGSIDRGDVAAAAYGDVSPTARRSP